ANGGGGGRSKAQILNEVEGVGAPAAHAEGERAGGAEAGGVLEGRARVRGAGGRRAPAGLDLGHQPLAALLDDGVGAQLEAERLAVDEELPDDALLLRDDAVAVPLEDAARAGLAARAPPPGPAEPRRQPPAPEPPAQPEEREHGERRGHERRDGHAPWSRDLSHRATSCPDPGLEAPDRAPPPASNPLNSLSCGLVPVLLGRRGCFAAPFRSPSSF